MGNDTSLISRIKAQITRFSSRLSDGLGKVKSRFVAEMLYGIQVSKDVKVSNVSRSLNEKVALIKTENRLCRNLCDRDLTSHINRRICADGARLVCEETVLAVDIGDIRKGWAKKMENLAKVHDGSTGEIADGYWLCQVVAAHPYGEKAVPLYGELYSQKAKGFVSENARMLDAIKTVTEATAGRGIVAIDRGGDRRTIIIPLIDNGLSFVVRQKGDRHIVMPSGAIHPISRAAKWIRTSIERTVEVEREGYIEKKHLRLGSMKAGLPERPNEHLWLVVVRGFGAKPIYLLTNIPLLRRDEHAAWISDIYLTRWKCEETYRYLKQSYNLEDVRVRSYTALRNTYALVHAVSYFVSAVIGIRAKMKLVFRKLCEKAKRFYHVAAFYHYAVADGIHRLLFSTTTPFLPSQTPVPKNTGQLPLPFAQPPP